MKIGDRIYVRGYIDEIRKDTVIVRNDGGYFGTVLSEVTGELPSAQPEIIRCRDCVKRETCRITNIWAVAPDDDWFCGDAERRIDDGE